MLTVIVAVAVPAATATAGPLPVQSGGVEHAAGATGCIGEGMHHGGDIAFWEHLAVVACGADDDDAANDGFSVVDIGDPRHPVTLSTFPCAGSASDVAVWGSLVFLAADTNNTQRPHPRLDPSRPVGFGGPVVEEDSVPCEEAVRPEPLDPSTDPDFFRGVRIVSIADPRAPRFVTHFDTDTRGGAHNLTVVPDLDAPDARTDPHVLVFVADPAGPTKIIRVPVGRSVAETRARAVVLDEPWTSDVKMEDACHDISIFLPKRLATCQKQQFGMVVMSIRDGLLSPKRLTFIDGPDSGNKAGSAQNPNHRYFHSSAFSWDGDKLVVTDEWLVSATCGLQAQDEPQSVGPGGISVYDVSNVDGADASKPRWRLLGRQASPQLQGPAACSSKQVNVVPLPSGRDVAVVSWVQGGSSMIDFTDGSRPRQIAHFLDPLGESRSQVWAAYWYDGHVYVSNTSSCLTGGAYCEATTRGIDVLAPAFSGSLASEFAAAVPQRRFGFALQECLRGLPPDAAVARCQG